MRNILVVGSLALLLSAATAQETMLEVKHAIALVQTGRTDEAERALPALQAKNPDDPAVRFLQGLLTSDGSEAVLIYQGIVDRNPDSEWADDALYKIYQFYRAVEFNTSADLKLAQLRTKYPNSPYVQGALQANAAVPERVTEEPLPAPVRPVVAPPPAVRVDSQAAATAQQEPTPSVEPAGGFALQVGAYSTEANASKAQAQMTALGIPTEIVTRERNGKTIFLLWSGTYASRDAARARAQELKTAQSIDVVVVGR